MHEKQGQMTVTSVSKIENKLSLQIAYAIAGDGSIKIDYSLNADESLPQLLRIGLSTKVPVNFSKMSYYKRSMEKLQERPEATEVNVYKGNVSDFVFKDAQPQECSNRTDVRCLQLQNENEASLGFEGAQALSTSV